MPMQSLICEPSWAEAEFATVGLNDVRLNHRCQVLAEALAQHPTMPINQACEDWADTKAAYRFMANAHVSPAKILAPHGQRTVARLKAYPLILAVQDTTFFNYTAHPQTDGLGEIGKKDQHQRGFGMHTTLALTPDGLPLGILTQAFFSRPIGEPSHTPKALHKLPIEEKESYRWLEALEQTLTCLPETVQAVSVCDREGDIYELFALADQREAGLLVRAKVDRCLAEKPLRHLWDKVEHHRRVGELTVEITGNQKRPARQASVSLRFCSVTLKPPPRPAGQAKLPPLTLTAILVREEHPPADLKEPIEWLLLTNTPVTTLADVERVVGWYCCRWPIEVFHKVLKSGCTVEACRLQTADRLQNYIAVMSVVAWRLHWLTYMNRLAPTQPCTVVLAPLEWQALYLHIHKTTAFPKKPPTVHQVVRWIAQLGGFLGRKADGEPGITVLWRGWQRLQDLAATWELIAKEQPKLMGNR
jgi:Transposase DNA-binding/Transposase Tn5 dimerisation domain